MSFRIAAALIPLSLLAQSVQRHKVTGLVLDSSGDPVAGASIDHTGNGKGQRWLYSTDAEGHFDLWTGAPAVVIRKGGYESFRLPIKNTKDPENVRIVLRPAAVESAGKSSEEPCTVETYESHDVDYTSTSMGLRTADGKWLSITCGQGPTWSWGAPSDSDVWNSVEYREVMLGDAKLGRVDARGKTSDGKYWRYRGVLGRSCFYSRADESAVGLLDRMMEGGCVSRSRK